MNTLLSQIKSITNPKLPLVTNLANISAILMKIENLNWCGFYLAEKDTLYLGPFQGDVACSAIQFGKGVCGTAAKEKKTVVVPNVHEFDGHIACSSLSKSEIVVPIIKNNTVLAVLDIDSPIYDRFHEKEKTFFEDVVRIIEDLLNA